MAAQLMESVLASELDHLVLPEILVQKKMFVFLWIKMLQLVFEYKHKTQSKGNVTRST